MPEQFANDLLLLEKLAQGGMAEVYRAKQIGVGGFQKNVAVKRILPECARVDEFKQMFLRETNLAAVLEHPNIIQVFSTGERDGYLYLIMEFLNGKTLQDIFDILSAANIQAPIDICCFILAEAAKGLGYAHNAKDPKSGEPLNVVHRDISPHNLMISYDGSVKVVDFGIAKAKNSSDLTQTGVIKGKEGYLAPELVTGSEADKRSDIFALGVVLYEMLSGKFLFDGETTLDTLKAIDACEVPEIIYKGAPLDQELDTILRKALARDRDERYQSCDQFARDLTLYLNQKHPGFTSQNLADFMYALFKEKILEERKLRESQDEKIPENAWEEMGATAVFEIPDELRKLSGGTGTIIIQQGVQEKEEKKEPETFKSKFLNTALWTSISLILAAIFYFAPAFAYEAIFSRSPSDFWNSLLTAQGLFDPATFSLKAVVAPAVGFSVVVLLTLSVPGLILGGLLGSRSNMFDVFLSLLSYVTFLFVALLGFNCVALLQKIESTALWFIVALRASIEQISQIVHLSPAITRLQNSISGKPVKQFIAEKLKSAELLATAEAQLNDFDIKVVEVGSEAVDKSKEAVRAIDSALASEITNQLFSFSLITETFLGLFAFGFLVVLANSISKHFLFKEKRKKLFQFYFVAFVSLIFFVASTVAKIGVVPNATDPSAVKLGFAVMPNGIFASLVITWAALILSILTLRFTIGTEQND